MGTYIVGLERQGIQLFQDVLQYCQLTEQPTDQTTIKQIYDQCLSQVVQMLTTDFQAFLINIQSLPVWSMIYYLEQPLPYDRVEYFRNSVRVFAIWLWTQMTQTGILHETEFYVFHHATLSILVLQSYVNADQA